MRNLKRWSFVLYIVGKQVISESEDRTSNHICGWHPKEVGGTYCAIIPGNKKLVRTNWAPKKLTTSMAKGIKQWRVQNIQTISNNLGRISQKCEMAACASGRNALS